MLFVDHRLDGVPALLDMRFPTGATEKLDAMTAHVLSEPVCHLVHLVFNMLHVIRCHSAILDNEHLLLWV